MEVPQGNSMYSYLKQAKMSFFSFIKSENRSAEQDLPGEEGGWSHWKVGRRWREGHWKVRM
jgi:hypothetical protein